MRFVPWRRIKHAVSRPPGWAYPSASNLGCQLTFKIATANRIRLAYPCGDAGARQIM